MFGVMAELEPEPEPEPSLAIVPFSENMVFTNPRLLATRRFDLHGKTIVLEQQHQKAAMASEWDAGGSLTGAAVWDASLVLAHYLPQLGSWRGRRVLELGAGAGLLAIACAQQGAAVTATDAYERVLELCRANAAANDAELATALLLWGDAAALGSLDTSAGGGAAEGQQGRQEPERQPPGWDWILAADCVYPGRRQDASGGADKPLLATLRAACSLRPPASHTAAAERTQVLLGYKTRSAEQLTFFALAKRAGFELDWVPQSSLHPDFHADGAADDPAECRGLAGGVHVCVMRLAAAIH